MSEETKRKGGKNPKHLAAKTQPERNEEPAPNGRSKTAGTNRDFDDSGESKNEGHGHPREERDRDGG
jgi:hypothetical protein